MSEFTIHTEETAPEGSKGLLKRVKGKYGFVPNILAEFAEAPNVLEAYLTLNELIAKGSLSSLEQQVIMITASRLNGCHYCVAAHSTVSDFTHLPTEVIDAVREDRAVADSKLEALRQFTKNVVKKQGWVSEDEVQSFLDAGYTKAQVLEVILGLSLKLISNYSNHIMNTPVDEGFQQRAIELKGYKEAAV